jgi:dTDP-4-amino-4,6-dideoxygalactose transaminase
MNSDVAKQYEESPAQRDFIVFGAPQICDDEIDEVVDSLRSGWLGTGPKVAKFEEKFKEYTGAEHAMALNSCTAGLHLSMLVAGLRPGDEVISTPMTFCATINTILHAGATPVLVDCERESQLICDIAQRHDLVVIEDAAHAIETVYKGRKVGNIGHLTCFSFYVTKNVVTGEGGMVTTTNSNYADKIKMYGLHGMSQDAWKRFSDEGYKHYQVVFPGFKYNMMDIQAAIGLHQLERVEENLARREQIWRIYDEAFADLPVGLPQSSVEQGSLHARHLYTLMIDKERCGLTRDEFMKRMYDANIGTGVHYIGVHLHQYYRERFGYQPQDFPNTTWLSERTVSIPLSPALSDSDVEDVIESVRSILKSS